MVYMKQSAVLAAAVAVASIAPVLAESPYAVYRRSDLYARAQPAAAAAPQDGWQTAFNEEATVYRQDKEIAQLEAQAAAAEKTNAKAPASKNAKAAVGKDGKPAMGKDGKPVNAPTNGKAAPKPSNDQQLFKQFEAFEKNENTNVNRVTTTPGTQSAGIKNDVAIDTRPKSRREAYEYAYLQARELLAREAYAYPEAYAYAEPEADYDEIYAREAEPEEYDSGLFARGAYASYGGLYARDADAYAYADYDDLYAREAEADPEAWAEAEADYEELYAREADAYAYAEAEADADYDWEASLYARDAEADAEASLTEYLKRYIGM